MNQVDLLGQWVQRDTCRAAICQLASKLCLREDTCRTLARWSGLWQPLSCCRLSQSAMSGCESFRGAGSELGERSERPRGKSKPAQLDTPLHSQL